MSYYPVFITNAQGGVTGCLDSGGNYISPAKCCNAHPNAYPNFCNNISNFEGWNLHLPGNMQIPNGGGLSPDRLVKSGLKRNGNSPLMGFSRNNTQYINRTMQVIPKKFIRKNNLDGCGCGCNGNFNR